MRNNSYSVFLNAVSRKSRVLQNLKTVVRKLPYGFIEVFRHIHYVMYRFAVFFIKAVVNILIARGFDKFDFGRSFSPVEYPYLAVFLFAAVTHVERALVDDYFVPVFYSEKPAVPVGRFVPVFDDDAYVIDFPYFINTPPEYFSLLL